MTHAEENIASFPTARKKAYRNQPGWRRRPLPGNVQMIRPPKPLPPMGPLPVTGYLVLALIQALRTKPKTWERTGGPDVLGALRQMMGRCEDDHDVAAQL